MGAGGRAGQDGRKRWLGWGQGRVRRWSGGMEACPTAGLSGAPPQLIGSSLSEGAYRAAGATGGSHRGARPPARRSPARPRSCCAVAPSAASSVITLLPTPPLCTSRPPRSPFTDMAMRAQFVPCVLTWAPSRVPRACDPSRQPLSQLACQPSTTPLLVRQRDSTARDRRVKHEEQESREQPPPGSSCSVHKPRGAWPFRVSFALYAHGWHCTWLISCLIILPVWQQRWRGVWSTCAGPRRACTPSDSRRRALQTPTSATPRRRGPATRHRPLARRGKWTSTGKLFCATSHSPATVARHSSPSSAAGSTLPGGEEAALPAVGTGVPA